MNQFIYTCNNYIIQPSFNEFEELIIEFSSKVICRGIVQGIGFRPFVFRIAIELKLQGFVRNQGDAGVFIIAEGPKKVLMKFIELLQTDKPYLAKYEDFHVEWEEFQNEFSDFEIIKSSKKNVGGISYLPPDISICDDRR